MNILKTTLYLIGLLPASLLGVTNFPFPQNAKYPYGIKPATINSNKIQTAYNSFIQRFYEESGDKARIKFDDPNYTVSEGIGYGMLIMVYMDNSTNNTRDKFDKLWKYYNSFLNDNQLMHWKITGFSSVSQQNAATDGDLDVAEALMQAYKQWGDEKYLTDAKSMIQKIFSKEVNSNGYLKPGDKWDSQKNPSYFSTAALENFKKGGSQDWSKVITNSYSLLNKVANSTTGLVPDWCTESGSPDGKGPNYSYDAARTPWRIAWGYVWYGHNDAKTFCSRIASWIASSTNNDPSAIVDGYNLNGNKTGQWVNTTFLGSFTAAGMVDTKHQDWLNKSYSSLESMVAVPESYFNTTLKMLYLLLISGNTPNFWDYTPAKTQNAVQAKNLRAISVTASGTTVSISGISSGAGTLKLIDLSGKCVLSSKYVQNGTGSVDLQVSSVLNKGIYCLQVQTVNGIQTQRLVIGK